MINLLKISSWLICLGFCSAILTLSCSRKQDTPSSNPVTSETTTSEKPLDSPNEHWVNFETGANVKTLTLEGDHLWMGLPNGIILYDTNTLDSHVVYTPTSTNGGLLSRGIYIIKVDSQGNKWIGTYGGGLTKFDGQTWKTYTMADGLGDQWVYDIAFDQNDLMWIATWKGVSVYNGKSFKTYHESDGLADQWVYAIALDHDGIFWFGTEAGVSRFDPLREGRSAWKTYTHRDGLGTTIEPSPTQTGNTPKTAIATSESSADGNTSNYESSAGAHHMDPQKRNAKGNPNFVIAAITDQQNNKWFGTWGAGLSRFDGNTWKTYTQANGLGGNYIHALAIDHEGYLWAGTNGGASWFDGTRWHNLNTHDGLINNNVFSFAFDAKGRRWFGTWTGLSMYQGPLPTSHLP